MAKHRQARSQAERNVDAKTLPDREALRVLIVAVPPVRSLDVIGPAEVFGDANRMRGGAPAYTVEIISAGEERVIASHIKIPLLTDRTYRESRGTFDTLLVAGGVGAREMRYQPAFLSWLREQCTSVRRFGSICTGAFSPSRSRSA